MKNSSEKKACIVIPVYKEKLSHNEQISLTQLVRLLGKFDIYFVGPENLNTKHLKHTLGSLGREFKMKMFRKKYFKSPQTYSRLLLSPFFYFKFIHYEYMLIYQLDAFVFKDELLQWCNSGFDYIGAPWFEGYKECNSNSKFIGVGNGGFSLRNIRKSLRCLLSFKRVDKDRTSLKLFFKTYNTPKRMLRYLPKYINTVLFKNYCFWLLNDYAFNEDIFWGKVAPKVFKDFKVGDFINAKNFSLELNAPTIYQKDKNLPFGCHGWFVHHTEFWMNIIQQYGYRL